MPHRTSRSMPHASAVRKNAPVLYRLRTLSRTTTIGSPALTPSTRAGTGRGEQRQVDRIRHRLVASIVGVQPVAGLKVLANLHGLFRIAHCGVEVHHAIVFTARPDPLVEFLPPGLTRFGPIESALERGERRAVNLQPSGVRSLDEGAMPADQILE